jgi:hypothetical protein
MRKLLIVTSLLLIAHIALLFTRRSASAEGTMGQAAASSVRIGIVLDVGGRGDKSFNDGAYAGADSATRMLGSNIRFIEPGEGADREAGLRLLAAEGMNLVIGVGFIFITLALQHAAGHGISILLNDLKKNQQDGYIALQRKEWADGVDIPTRSHHEFTGVPYHQHLGQVYGANRMGSEVDEHLEISQVV